jgi:micrococcal nuclease
MSTRAVLALTAVSCAVAVAAGSSSGDRSSATLAYVVDGDTIALTSGRHVRLLQIDTPELGSGECYARRAARDLRTLLHRGATVELLADARLDAVDRYGRLLRYVFHQGVDINLRLVARGDATVWFYRGARGRYARQLLDAARRARAERRGIWRACRTVWNPYAPATTRRP